MLQSKGVIDYNLQRVNRDEVKVYCTGDLIDGDYNRHGDHLLLKHAPEWFDAVCIGNHEFAFIGGPDFGGKRDHDRDLVRSILNLEREGVYVPAVAVEGYLLVHAGLADRWSFQTAEDAAEAIGHVWRMSNEEEAKGGWPMLDWIGPGRAGKWANDTGGIFWLDWTEARNSNFNQIVGHSTMPHGPISKHYANGVEHWNIDTGGKTGYCLGGVEIENGKATPFFWGQRFRWADPEPEESSVIDDDNLWQEVNFDLSPKDEEEEGPYDRPYSFEGAVDDTENPYSYDPADDFRAMMESLPGE